MTFSEWFHEGSFCKLCVLYFLVISHVLCPSWSQVYLIFVPLLYFLIFCTESSADKGLFWWLNKLLDVVKSVWFFSPVSYYRYRIVELPDWNPILLPWQVRYLINGSRLWYRRAAWEMLTWQLWNFTTNFWYFNKFMSHLVFLFIRLRNFFQSYDYWVWGN